MKTYNIIYVLLALLAIGCSKSDEDTGGEQEQKEEEQIGVEADYAMLLSNGSQLTTQLLSANAKEVTLNPAETLADKSIPQLTSINGTTFFQYHKKSDCGGQVTTYDFASNKTEEIDLFVDMNDCALTANAISFSDSALFVAYELEIDIKTYEYMVRVIDLKSTDFSFIDVPLNKKPVDLVSANGRLFILTLDLEISDENFLSVLDLNSNALIHEKSLGSRARRIFQNTDDEIIISYDELHTTLNSSNLSVLYTNYGAGAEPKFTSNTTDHFDFDGRLYYPIASESVSIYPEIPAVYDFTKNLVTMYAFENFLTAEKREFEFEIETTTAINYDKENNIILIGYKKRDKQKGGLLRIKPAPEPAFIDNIDLSGVPYEIFIY